MVGKYRLIKQFKRNLYFNRVNNASKVLDELFNKNLLTNKEYIKLSTELDFAYITNIKDK